MKLWDALNPLTGLRASRPHRIRRNARAGAFPKRRVSWWKETGGFAVANEFTAIIEKDGDWFVAYCPEIPGANGQGNTKDAARENLANAIKLILEDRREDGLRGIPADAIRETVIVK